MSAAVVYRFYDADLRLLYVGQSTNLMQRISGHRSQVSWWPDVDTVTVEHFDSREKALAAEAEAIRTELPKHNVRGIVQRPQSKATEWDGQPLYVNVPALVALAQIDGFSEDDLDLILKDMGSLDGLRSRPATADEVRRLAAFLSCTPEALCPGLGGFTRVVA